LGRQSSIQLRARHGSTPGPYRSCPLDHPPLTVSGAGRRIRTISARRPRVKRLLHAAKPSPGGVQPGFTAPRAVGLTIWLSRSTIGQFRRVGRVAAGGRSIRDSISQSLQGLLRGGPSPERRDVMTVTRADELQTLPLFAGLSHAALRFLATNLDEIEV